jgi:hypothetical protein
MELGTANKMAVHYAVNVQPHLSSESGLNVVFTIRVDLEGTVPKFIEGLFEQSASRVPRHS